MVKFCILHNKPLTKIPQQTNSGLQTYMRALNKHYKCKFGCQQDDWHIYCYLCNKVILTSGGSVASIYKHNSAAHFKSIDVFAFYAKKLIVTNMRSSDEFLLDIVRMNPQIALVYPNDKIKLIDRENDESSTCEFPKSESDRKDMLEAALKSSSVNYHCRLCDENYDSSPPSLLEARKHIRECYALLRHTFNDERGQ